MTFFNGGPAQVLTPAFSCSVACNDQAEIDPCWDKLLEGGKPMACGWLTDKFGLCWQIVPEKIGEILKHPKAMAAMMTMVKVDIATLGAAANGERRRSQNGKGPFPLATLPAAIAEIIEAAMFKNVFCPDWPSAQNPHWPA
jgi:hypothetical protein